MQCDTKKKLLDNAERLFAQGGVHATSIREVTHAARVNVASINYHFGSKAELIAQVIERRLVPLNKARTERLLQVKMSAEAQGCRPCVDNLLSALIEPSFEFVMNLPESQYFFELVSRALGGSDAQVKVVFWEQFEPMFSLVQDCMHTALPELPLSVLQWRLHFAVGALHSALRMLGQNESELGNNWDANNTPAMMETLLAFISSGMREPYL